MDQRPPTTSILAKNLAYLMDKREWDTVQCAKQVGIDQKTIWNILNEKKKPTVETVDKIASAFGLSSWHLILPHLIEDLEGETSIRKLYDDYFASGPNGKRFIASVAERERDLHKAS